MPRTTSTWSCAVSSACLPVCERSAACRGVSTRFPDLDLLIIRENSEDIYKGIEHEIVPGVIESIKVVTREASERIARFAFETAIYLEREHLTFVHKANIMKKSDGLFLETVTEVAEEYPQIPLRTVIVDAACMQLVLDPYQFDVLLMGNLYGDVLSSLCNGITGGISSSLGIDIGDDVRIYESIHGDAAELVGEGSRQSPPPAHPGRRPPPLHRGSQGRQANHRPPSKR